jgi:hypothetical protein
MGVNPPGVALVLSSDVLVLTWVVAMLSTAIGAMDSEYGSLGASKMRALSSIRSPPMQ